MKEVQPISLLKFSNFEEISNKYKEHAIQVQFYSEVTYEYPLAPALIAHSREMLSILPLSNFTEKKFGIINIKDDSLIGILQSKYKKGAIKNCELDITILPDFQSKGFATVAILEFLKNLPKHLTVIQVAANSKPEFLGGMLLKLGFKLVYCGVRSACDLSKVKIDRLRKMSNRVLYKAKEKGYKFLFFENFDFSKVSQLDEENFLKIFNEVVNDMPSEDMTSSEELFGHEDLAIMKKNLKIRKRTSLSYVVMKEEKIVGFTNSMIDELNLHTIRQNDTGVIKKHRGNSLGLAMKSLMLEKIITDERSMSRNWWTTNNAKSNYHMIKINEELGYKVISNRTIYEISRKKLTSILTSKLQNKSK